VLNDGQLVQVDAARRLYEKPRNLFVATFIGSPSMNILDGTIIADGGPKVMVGASAVPLPGHLSGSTSADRPVKLGIRPEHLKLSALGGQSTGSLSGEVSLVEIMGDESIITALVENSPLRVKLHGECPYKMGDRITLAADPQHIHLFDAATGERIEGNSIRAER
jgi:ABC-type sugar transport system ATPase subunit